MSENGVWIDDELYATIKSVMPVLCVDMLIRDADGRVLLGKRNNSPAKGEWWIPGGRVLIWETLVSAVHRKALQELSVDVVIDSVVGTYDNIFPGEVHTVTVIHACHLDSSVLKTDDQHSEYRWFTPAELLELELLPLLRVELADRHITVEERAITVAQDAKSIRVDRQAAWEWLEEDCDNVHHHGPAGDRARLHCRGCQIELAHAVQEGKAPWEAM